jgi:hypothetical protein
MSNYRRSPAIIQDIIQVIIQDIIQDIIQNIIQDIIQDIRFRCACSKRNALASARGAMQSVQAGLALPF